MSSVTRMSACSSQALRAFTSTPAAMSRLACVWGRLFRVSPAKGFAGATLADVAAVLEIGLEDTVRKALISTRNPARLVPKPKGERVEDAFIVLLHTGLRATEWLGLDWQHADLDGAGGFPWGLLDW